MASLDKKTTSSWVDAIPSIIDSVTNLYNAVAVKSPNVANTVVILGVLFPFYLVYVRASNVKKKEKAADQRVKAGKKDSSKPGKAKPEKKHE